uniref:synaptonemal complex protein 2-like isoform X2 n=1 Tax=Fragaria vesca subsp. vesca TaxID=101020 RepID=UPI0005C9A338|nr:PREDICTED: synaptonemal complex protein 2-like isoform X2 [Fragaria vesca subsp. vesca]
MKSLDQFKSLSKSASGGPPKTFAYSSRPPESSSSGSLANLKLTAEKFMKEQASVKTDLEMATTKLKKSMEHICASEEKLQDAFNENAKFKVKQKEDEKLWKGLESKFSSTLQLLAGQVQDDKEAFEGKLSVSAVALDGKSQQMDDLSINLESAEQTIMNREKELEEHRLEKEETDKLYRNEQCRTANLIGGKDAMIKNFEETLATNRLATESLNTKLGEVHLELKLKEDGIRRLMTAQENSDTEKHDLHLSNDDLVKRLDMSVLEIKNLEGFVHVLVSHLAELDRQSLNFLEKYDKLNSLYEACFQLVNQEKDLFAKLAQRQYNQLHDRFLNLTSEKDAIQLVNQVLNSRVMELQNIQESIMTQLSEESHTARERIQKLESETEALVSKKIETQKLVSDLERQIDSLSESSSSSENKMQDLLIKISALETENKDNTEKLQAEMQKKAEQIDGLPKEGETHERHVDLMDKQVSQLHSTIEEKEQLVVQCKEREKNLEEQITENGASLTAAETRLVEDKKQYDLVLESKQLELSRHLKEISQRNDQAINDIWKKYEVEKLEIVNMEKQKAENLVRDWQIECEKKLEECKEETRQHLMRVQEEHAALEYSNSLRRNPVVRRRGQRSLRRPEHDEKDSPLVGATQTPVSTLLKKASENMNSPSVMYISKHHNKDPRRQKRSIFSLPLLIALISIIITATAASPSSTSPPPPPPSSPSSLSISPGIIRKIVCLIIAYAVTVTTVSLASPAMFRMWQDYLTAWVDWFYSTHHFLVAPFVNVFSALYRCLFVVIAILVIMLLVVPAFSL